MKRKRIRISTNLGAGILGLLFAALLFVLTKNNIQIPVSETDMINSATVPYLLALLIGACSLALLGKTLVLKHEVYEERDIQIELRNLIFIGLLIVYVALMPYLGFLLTSLAFSAGTLFFVGCRNTKHYCVVLLFVAAVWAVFRFGLKIDLPGFLGGGFYV